MRETWRLVCQKLYGRAVKLIFTGGHISLTVAFKGPKVILGLYKCNYCLARGKELYIWPFEGNHKADMAPPHENEFDTPAIWESFWFSFDKANYYLSLRTCDSRCDIELGKGQQSPFHKNFVLLMVALIMSAINPYIEIIASVPWLRECFAKQNPQTACSKVLRDTWQSADSPCSYWTASSILLPTATP